MKYLLITNMYPKEGDLYRNAFIHSRIRSYIKYQSNIDITVFVLNDNIQYNQYTFETINVIEGNNETLLSTIKNLKPKKLLIHFLNTNMMEVIRKINFNIPTLIWVHGTEALGWYRRLFYLERGIKRFSKYVVKNIIQMYNFKKFIRESNDRNVTYIFVSNWMKNILESDTLSTIKKYKIIPNSVDNSIFEYKPKNLEDRKKILLIRSFETKKYANDLAIKAILMLSKRPFFEELEFTIYGEGKHFTKLISRVKHFNNVKCYNKFLKHNEIAEVHKEHGVFLCPTRQDSQGVSMCEAMSSGLVPITSNNTAIPEFVVNKKSGLLTNNVHGIAKAIEYLYYNPQEYISISRNASVEIQKKCNPNSVINKELQLINE